jgi:biotin carboxyl carrier protein
MNNLALREYIKRDIHNLKPQWYIRWGISFFALSIIAILVIGAIIKYPDLIVGEARITSTNPPATLVCKNNLYIDKIIVADGDSVKSGEIILSFVNPAKIEDVQKAKYKVREINISNLNSEEVMNELLTLQLELGELQPLWVGFVKSVCDLSILENSKRPQIKEKILKKQQLLLNTLTVVYDEIKLLKKEEEHIMLERLSVDSTLFSKNISSREELYQSTLSVLATKQNVKNFESTLLETKVKVDEINYQLNEMNEEQKENIRLAQMQLLYAQNNLLAEIEKWEEIYLIKSPMDGIVYYVNVVRNHHFLSAGELIVTVVPFVQHNEAYIKIPFIGAGKIQKEQKVRIKLEDYPFKEYGTLIGNVNNVSRAANVDYYIVYASLPNGLKSSFEKNLTYHDNMLGIGEIVTKDKSILARLVENITYVFDQD